ncbi:MAG: hypothetical protein HKO92_03785 [Flavobacteriaceae bacterium]|nr:hypothetical protein [Flavobacteriaceae bacterium]
MKKLLIILLVTNFLYSCKKEQDPFLISKQNIGFLTDSTQVKDLKTVFPNDSIHRYIGGDEFTGSINDINILQNTGELLLVLTPTQALDSSATINNVRVIDSRFKTETGLNAVSTFKDIKDNYQISNIQNTLKNIVISLDNENFYLTIDKKELPSEMRYDMNLKIEEIHIPDNAKIKYFMIDWN